MENTSRIYGKIDRVDVKSNEEKEQKSLSEMTKVMAAIVVLHIVAISGLYYLGMNFIVG